ncbi:MAG: hypothetical protein GEU82_18025 [Luteitalea sp.]|nr:hypothetical protein [Luteitalea sp.]
MPVRKPLKSVSRRPVQVPVPQALRAARRALDQQTARVTELEGRIRELTARREPAANAPVHVALTDTAIYWRRRPLR